MNIFDFAIGMESDGKAYYEKLAAETQDGGLKNIFTRLAADEQKHLETIQSIKAGAPASMANSTAIDEARNVFRTLLENRSVAEGMRRSLDGYRHALKIEADSVRLYEEMAKKVADQDTVQLILTIANEEKRHYNIMDNICDFVQAPEQFLAWGEFSNLKEL